MTANNLTRREREIMTLIACGYNNKEIAKRLVIEMSTVKSHVYRIFRKPGARNRLEACTVWFKHTRRENDDWH